jgi:hypothetical protein
MNTLSIEGESVRVARVRKGLVIGTNLPRIYMVALTPSTPGRCFSVGQPLWRSDPERVRSIGNRGHQRVRTLAKEYARVAPIICKSNFRHYAVPSSAKNHVQPIITGDDAPIPLLNRQPPMLAPMSLPIPKVSPAAAIPKRS